MNCKEPDEPSLADYFSAMRLVSQRADAEMASMMQVFIANASASESSRAAARLVERRRMSGRPKLRPLIFYASARTRAESTSAEVLSIATICELINIATYLLNLSLDHKGAHRKNEATPQWLGGILLQSFCSRAIDNLSLPQAVRVGMSKALFRGFGRVADGLGLDIGPLSDPATIMRRSRDEFLKLYIARCGLLGGASLEAICTAGAEFAGSDDQRRRAQLVYGVMHGLALQVINDIADFVPVTRSGRSVGKDLSDQFADLRNCRMTLPVYELSRHPQSLGVGLLFGRTDNAISSETITTALKEVDAFGAAIDLAQAADSIALEHLEACDDEFGELLRHSLHVSRSNRFFGYLRQNGYLHAPIQSNPAMREMLIKYLTEWYN